MSAPVIEKLCFKRTTMRTIALLAITIFGLLACKSTEKGFTKQELDFFESQKIISTWGHLTEDELALAILGTTCYKKYLVLKKYNYKIESVSKNQIIYYQPNNAKVTSNFDTTCPDSVHFGT
jgi:hypothetical protein